MTNNLEHMMQDGGIIKLNKNGPSYAVECWDKEYNIQWYKSFRKREDALKEFARWMSA